MRLEWLPNLICVARMLLAVPIVALLLAERYEAALLLTLIAGFSDGLDGFLAKTFDWRTRLGSLLDPAADKLLLVSVFLALTHLGLVPVALTVIVVLRDVVIVAGTLTYQVLVGPVRGEPSLISKLNTACQLGFLFLTLTQAAYGWPVGDALTILGGLVVFTSITSGLDYVVGWSRRAWQAIHAAS